MKGFVIKNKYFKSLVTKKNLFLLLFFNICILCLSAEDQTSLITIENAQKAEYLKDTETGDDIISLTGSVQISVEKGETKTVITADKVNYNRKTEMMYATGSVSLVQSGTKSEGGQNVTADRLLFNTGTLEGVFDNGRAVQTQSDALNLPSGSTLIVSSSIFGRDSSNTISFKNGVLTFCDEQNPHWKIKASRIWLLPGGEFAFFNAILFVGYLPVVYLPAFYYPKDELIFNPVFGYNKRTGYYIQTTTYLFGRKPLDSTSSVSSTSDDAKVSEGLFNFMKLTKLKDQKREGLVLHNLDSDYTGNSNDYLKLMIDYYSNLGVLTGLKGVLKPKKVFSNLEASVNLGFSNTIFADGNDYLPFGKSGTVYNDVSNFLGVELPFRYSAELKLTMSKPLNLTLTLPVYSDPFFTYDFGDRKESMDWIGFLMSSAEDTEEDISSSKVTSFTWSLNGSYNVKIPEKLKPFISTFSLSSLSSQVIFSSRTTVDIRSTSDNWSLYSPEREFFYPSQISPFKISGKIAGSIVEYPVKSKKINSSSSVKFPRALELPEMLNTEQSPETNLNVSNSSITEENETEHDLETLILPDLSINIPSNTQPSDIQYQLSYTISPEFLSQLNYNSSEYKKPSDFNLQEIDSSYYQVKSPVTMTSSFKYLQSFLSLNNTLSFTPVFQEHPNLDGYTVTSAATVKQTDYNARKLDLSNNNTFSFHPFINSNYFSKSGLEWETKLLLVRTKFIGDADNPEWEYLTTDLTDDECVTTHELSAIFSAEEGKFSQTIKLSTTLPPQVDKYDGVINLVFPYISLNFSTGIQKKSITDNTWIKQPFQQSLSVAMFNNSLTLSESYNYNLEDEYSDTMRISMSWKGFQLAYTMQYTYGYDFITEAEAAIDSSKDAGWQIRDNKEFLPVSISLAYAKSNKTFRYWRNRITFSPNISSSVVLDCLRPTNSYFRIIPSISFKINEFLDISLSAESRNNTIFRYFQDYIGYENTVGGEKNPFVDLWNSFVFWGDDTFYDPEQTVRKQSGYKIKNLAITITHNLCDWDLTASFKVAPRLLTTNSGFEYDFSPYLTVAVIWRPLSSMKTEIRDDYGDWMLNP